MRFSLSPAMDIQVASNFERHFYSIRGRCGKSEGIHVRLSTAKPQLGAPQEISIGFRLAQSTTPRRWQRLKRSLISWVSSRPSHFGGDGDRRENLRDEVPMVAVATVILLNLLKQWGHFLHRITTRLASAIRQRDAKRTICRERSVAQNAYRRLAPSIARCAQWLSAILPVMDVA